MSPISTTFDGDLEGVCASEDEEAGRRRRGFSVRNLNPRLPTTQPTHRPICFADVGRTKIKALDSIVPLNTVA